LLRVDPDSPLRSKTFWAIAGTFVTVVLVMEFAALPQSTKPATPSATHTWTS
jgi:hypothetical protein